MAELFSLPDHYLRIALTVMDVGSALLVIYLMQSLTPHACFTGSAQNKWAMLRRFVFAFVSYALFARGVWRINKISPVDWWEFHTQFIIILGLVLFAVMRAMNVITQDEWRERH